jgi:hypothetical protein
MDCGIYEDEIAQRLINGTLDEYIDDIEENMRLDKECGALVNIVNISSADDLESLLEYTYETVKNSDLFGDSDNNNCSFELNKDAVDSGYFYFKLGQYYFYVFQPDCLHQFRTYV